MAQWHAQGAIELSSRTTTGTLVGQGATRSRSGATYRAMLAQGATEYLVLLAVVLIIALVSVSLLGFFPGMASDAQETQSKMYWQSASPIAIMEWAARYANDGVSPGYTHFYMRIKNTGTYPIRLTKLLANGRSTSKTCISSWGCDTGNWTNTYLYPGEEKIFGYPSYFSGIPYLGSGNLTFFVLEYQSGLGGSLSSNCSRTAPYGTAMINNFGFEYTQYIESTQITKRQIGIKPVIIKCLNNYD